MVGGGVLAEEESRKEEKARQWQTMEMRGR
jgi:hypothetical protein